VPFESLKNCVGLHLHPACKVHTYTPWTGVWQMQAAAPSNRTRHGRSAGQAFTCRISHVHYICTTTVVLAKILRVCKKKILTDIRPVFISCYSILIPLAINFISLRSLHIHTVNERIGLPKYYCFPYLSIIEWHQPFLWHSLRHFPTYPCSVRRGAQGSPPCPIPR
jgi:hypothetical protein